MEFELNTDFAAWIDRESATIAGQVRDITHEYPPEPVVVLQQGEAALARIAQAVQPDGTPQLGEVHPVRRPFLSANQNYTPAALSPLRRQNPREEPGALAAHAGICAGGEEKSSSLPRP
jgi:hypothetical protein